MTFYRNIRGAAEVDLNIPEDFPRESLLNFIDGYIKVCQFVIANTLKSQLSISVPLINFMHFLFASLDIVLSSSTSLVLHTKYEWQGRRRNSIATGRARVGMGGGWTKPKIAYQNLPVEFVTFYLSPYKNLHGCNVKNVMGNYITNRVWFVLLQ